MTLFLPRTNGDRPRSSTFKAPALVEFVVCVLNRFVERERVGGILPHPRLRSSPLVRAHRRQAEDLNART
jgi:hypothetical protein